MTLSDQVIKNIVLRVIKSQDYRVEVVNLINAEFLQFAVDFFKQVVSAKLNSETVTIDWYKKAFMNEGLPAGDIAINSGLNTKTITNIYGSASKKIVIEASNEHFDSLYNTIEELAEIEDGIDLTLTIKFRGVSVELNVSESLIVINALAVKRSALRSGLWSSAGKRAEKHLMLALCKLYQVDERNYSAERFIRGKGANVEREVDFCLKCGGNEYKCEVKLMGKGNPESADAIIARGSNVLVADTLSEQNKRQCEKLGICWVACREKEGYRRFRLALEKLAIPYTDYSGNLDEDLTRILDELMGL